MSDKRATASDVMTSPVHVLQDDMDVREAVQAFQSHHVSGAPVVDRDERLVGVLSQTDVMHWYLSRDDELVTETDYYHRPNNGPRRLPGGFKIVDTNVPRVADLMTPVTIAATADTPIEDLARTMIERKVHRIIITHEGDRVAGIVSALDLLRRLTS
jgi:CBS domain-containing protein